MTKNKFLNQVLENLPQGNITYVHKPNEEFNYHYTLTAKNYKEVFLDGNKLFDLTPEEQLILVNSNNRDPLYTPHTTLAGIYKSREIVNRSIKPTDSILKCNSELVRLNQAILHKREEILRKISEENLKANLLDYYLTVETKCEEYERKQNSILAPVRNMFNRILGKITKTNRLGPPFSDDERQRGATAWHEFRLKHNAPDNVSNRTLLNRYRYHADFEKSEPFSFMLDTPELKLLEEEYSTTNMALKILDGSAYKQALLALNKNPRSYVDHVKKLREH